MTPSANYLLAGDAERPRFCDRLVLTEQPAIVIIGAGFTGLSAALHLAQRRPAERILLLERDRVAAGPSGKCAGHVCGLQASDDAVRRHCGAALAARLIAAAEDAQRLVRQLIERHAIECDLRDGYVTLEKDGTQSLSQGGLNVGIDPYPFALGLARAATRLGVEIHEGVAVTGLQPSGTGCRVATSAGEIVASRVLACGGHRMAETIPLLAPLRRRTTELRVITIITDPLPDAVLAQALPAAASGRFPFANDAADVAYGSILRDNRLVLGAHATAFGDVAPDRIMRTMARLLPKLLPAYRASTGRELGWRPLVVGETLCFTRDFLPNVGSIAGGVLYAHGFGGHGMALGTLLGRAAAEKIGGGSDIFDAFTEINHGWLPAAQPWRAAAAKIGLIKQALLF